MDVIGEINLRLLTPVEQQTSEAVLRSLQTLLMYPACTATVLEAGTGSFRLAVSLEVINVKEVQ